MPSTYWWIFVFNATYYKRWNQGSERLQAMKVGPVSNDSMQGEGEVKVGGEPGSETCAADHEDGAVLYY